MNKNILFIMLGILALINSGCSKEFDDKPAKNDLSPSEIIEHEYVINHPCLLHTNADFEYVKAKVEAQAEPWYSGWLKLKNNTYSYPNYTPNVPEAFANGNADISVAYQHALIWKITGDEAFAKSSINILNQWAQKCKSIQDNGILVTAFQGYQFANVAEIMRTYSGWAKSDFEAYQKWMEKLFLPICYKFLNERTDPIGMGWISWEATANLTLFSIAILCDNEEMINYSLDYFYKGGGPGSIQHMIVEMHEDPAGRLTGKKLGQSIEMGRDQGHAAIAVPILGAYCQSAYNIGIDLFAYDDNKVLALCEYYAKYNVKPNEPVIMPFTRYYTSKDGGKWQEEVSSTGRGESRPGWELIYNHYAKIKKVETPYSGDFAEKMRPEGGYTDYSMGGKGDQFGFGTLMYSRD